jgi:hypothetical protein
MKIFIQKGGFRLLFCLFMLLLNGVAFSKNNAPFAIENKPIHPGCIALFNKSLAGSDYPSIIQSVNLTTCQHSNVAYRKLHFDIPHGYYQYENNKNFEDGYYGYKFIGKTKNNIYVLNTNLSGGGKGNFDKILLLQLAKKELFQSDSDNPLKKIVIQELSLIGDISGGDRCAGGIATIKITGNILSITKYQGETPNDCEKTKEITFDLSRLKS